VLGGVAAIAGLLAAHFALRWWLGVSAAEAGGRLPFWFSDRLTAATVLYAVLLAVLGAALAGVVPALKVTGRRVEARLRQATAGGGLRFGGIWTLVIVTQVAVTVAFPATAFFAGRYAHEVQSLDVGFPSSQYLAARLEMDGEVAAGASADTARARFVSRTSATYQELEQRLAAEPAVGGVTFTDRFPRTQHPLGRIEVDTGGAAPGDSVLGYPVSRALVAASYFATLGAPILSGRGFDVGDLESGRHVVVVNQSFVHLVLGNRNPIGRRMRYLGVNSGSADARPNAWYEIVGVVKDLGMITDDPHNGAGVYHPMVPGAAQLTQLVVHVKGDPDSFAPRLRAIATRVDPALRLQDLMRLDQVGKTMWMELEFLSRLLVIVSAVALLLSLATIYAVMSFTVSRRTREIGVRVALGADAMRVAAAIFARPLVNVGLGVAAGGILVCLLVLAVSAGTMSGTQVAAIVAYAVIMMGVCMLACVVPTRRALRVQPTEALRADA
jgi:putative ABC transport system permease protein